jgi:hypothetical protein
MAAVAEQNVDLDAIEAEAREQVDALREDRARLALDGLSDPDAAGELLVVEARLAEAEDALERVGLARRESDRRGVEARSQAERDLQAAALAEGQRLQGERVKAAQAVDQAAEQWVAAVGEYQRVSHEQAAQFRAAGRRVSAPNGWPVEASLAYFMARGRVRDVLERLPVIQPRNRRPLVATISPGKPAKQ